MNDMKHYISYCEPTIRKAYEWLGHSSSAYTQLDAIDSERKKPTRTAYMQSASQVLDFVKRHYQDSMVCWGLNERPYVLQNEQGFARSAKNTDIEIVSNFAIDIDLQSRPVTDNHRKALHRLVNHEVSDYHCDLGLLPPAYADTGQGGHLVYALPRTKISQHPDITKRNWQFATELSSDLSDQLSDIGAKVDNISDARRVVKVYGTAKPEVGYVSKFFADKRVEDTALLEHLLAFEMEAEAVIKTPVSEAMKPVYGATLITVQDQIPQVVASLLERDEKLRNLYDGNGKTHGDTSGSGYDISLIRRLLILGVYDVSVLATVLAHRPNGSVQNSKKGNYYLRTTVAAAITGK
ncbi:MAG: hypothetical protein GY761_13170 [Hyphomicrobiales bacterium]|nr:hypothetical protein [Hyphomicrobiales bacterium]